MQAVHIFPVLDKVFPFAGAGPCAVGEDAQLILRFNLDFGQGR